MSFTLIETKEDVEYLNKDLLSQSSIAVDTEFRRLGKEDIKLALIQVNDKTETYIIDCIKIGEYKDYCSFLSEESVQKVFHSAREDMEAILSWTDLILTNVFDTQLANDFLGGLFSIGYKDLVYEKLGVSIEEDETRSNWIRRPLRDSQLHYAASDVQFLLDLHSDQKNQLKKNRKLDWLYEEIEFLFNQILLKKEQVPLDTLKSISKEEEKNLLKEFNDQVLFIAEKYKINHIMFFSKKKQREFLRTAIRKDLNEALNNITLWRRRLFENYLNVFFEKLPK